MSPSPARSSFKARAGLWALLFVCMLREGLAFTRRTHPKADPSSLRMAGAEELTQSLTATPPIKLALLVEPTPFGYVSGYKNRFEEMLKYLKKAGDKVSILTADKVPDTAAREFLGYPIAVNRGWELAVYPLVTVTFDFAMQSPGLIEDLRPEVLHASSPSAIMYPAVLWSWYYELPLVFSYHTDFVQYGQIYGQKMRLPPWAALFISHALVRFFHHFADLTLCTSPQLRDSMAKLGIKESRLDVWQKGINVERFSPSFRSAEMRNRLSGGHPESPLIVYVGRLGPEKRIERLKRVLDENPGVHLALVGKGPAAHEEELKKLFENYPVVFTGQIVGDELSQAFASADLFVMPSDSETLGFVVLEAMASGVPVVAVAAGGLIDIVEDGNTGYLVSNTDDMEQFSRRTKEILAEPQLRKKMGTAARRWAESWSWEAATTKLRNLQYRKAIENHRSRNAIDPQANKSLMKQAYTFRPDLA